LSLSLWQLTQYLSRVARVVARSARTVAAGGVEGACGTTVWTETNKHNIATELVTKILEFTYSSEWVN
jgi:hypothetical protein